MVWPIRIRCRLAPKQSRGFMTRSTRKNDLLLLHEPAVAVSSSLSLGGRVGVGDLFLLPSQREEGRKTAMGQELWEPGSGAQLRRSKAFTGERPADVSRSSNSGGAPTAWERNCSRSQHTVN